MCNPPFYTSANELKQSAEQKEREPFSVCITRCLFPCQSTTHHPSHPTYVLYPTNLHEDLHRRRSRNGDPRRRSRFREANDRRESPAARPRPMVHIHARQIEQYQRTRRNADQARHHQFRSHRVRAGKQNEALGRGLVMGRQTACHGKSYWTTFCVLWTMSNRCSRILPVESPAARRVFCLSLQITHSRYHLARLLT